MAPLPPAVLQLIDQVRDAGTRRASLAIEAGGTKAFYGRRVDGERLDPRVHRGLVSYTPSELVVTVRAGTPLAELEAALEQERQMLAFEPPHFGATATVGGAIAAGLAGPRRTGSGLTAGGVRDAVLGVTLLDGRGDVLSFGGTVVKNVAGYDVSRLVAGSLGTLGILLAVSLKVVPMPAADVTVAFELSEAEALVRVRELGAWPVVATAWHDGRLHLRLAGATAAVEAARRALGGEMIDTSAVGGHWASVRDLALLPLAQATTLLRAVLPPATGMLSVPSAMVDGHGQRRWLAGDLEVASLRAEVARAGGHLTVFRGAPGLAPFPARSPIVAMLERRVRASLDPLGLFNPGRDHADTAV
jgi:glycolate oxidase FAD binding subunit